MYLSEYSLQYISDFKYVTGDSVCFKRMNSKEWYGPAKVPGSASSKWQYIYDFTLVPPTYTQKFK